MSHFKDWDILEVVKTPPDPDLAMMKIGDVFRISNHGYRVRKEFVDSEVWVLFEPTRAKTILYRELDIRIPSSRLDAIHSCFKIVGNQHHHRVFHSYAHQHNTQSEIWL